MGGRGGDERGGGAKGRSTVFELIARSLESSGYEVVDERDVEECKCMRGEGRSQGGKRWWPSLIICDSPTRCTNSTESRLIVHRDIVAEQWPHYLIAN